jgi:hypothetical protein
MLMHPLIEINPVIEVLWRRRMAMGITKDRRLFLHNE